MNKPNASFLIRQNSGTSRNTHVVNMSAGRLATALSIGDSRPVSYTHLDVYKRQDPQHLAWTLENLAEGHVVNQIKVPAHEVGLAKLALERMLAVS